MLTQAERDKFIEYLEQDASSNHGLITQMNIIGAPEALINKLILERDAARIIAAKLRSIESIEVRR